MFGIMMAGAHQLDRVLGVRAYGDPPLYLQNDLFRAINATEETIRDFNYDALDYATDEQVRISGAIISDTDRMVNEFNALTLLATTENPFIERIVAAVADPVRRDTLRAMLAEITRLNPLMSEMMRLRRKMLERNITPTEMIRLRVVMEEFHQ